MGTSASAAIDAPVAAPNGWPPQAVIRPITFTLDRRSSGAASCRYVIPTFMVIVIDHENTAMAISATSQRVLTARSATMVPETASDPGVSTRTRPGRNSLAKINPAIRLPTPSAP